MVTPLSMTVGPSTTDVSTASSLTRGGIRFMPRLWRHVLNLVAFVVNTAVTFGTSAVLGTPTNGELSVKYQTLVTPVGWAFAIWGLIFLSQGIWAILQVLPKFRANELVEAVGFSYIGVCVAQVMWTIVFSQEWILVSMGAMIGILLCLLLIVWSQQRKESVTATWKDWVLLQFPFAVHTGWIVAATVVNANVVLVSQEFGQREQYYAALASLGFVVLAAVVFVFYERASNAVMALVLSWATVSRRTGLSRFCGNRKCLTHRFCLFMCVTISSACSWSWRIRKMSLARPLQLVKSHWYNMER